MDKKRQKLVREFFDRNNILNLNNNTYSSYVNNLIDGMLEQDIDKGDITTNFLIDKKREIKAYVTAREDGIVAGIEEISLIMRKEKIKIAAIKKDGDKIKDKDILFELYGNARKILAYERTLLNILQRMSGIATAVYNLKKITKNDCFIAGTRKTLLPLLDKKAISVGGALTHRLGLDDAVLIKDNHLKILGNNIEKALKQASSNKKTKYIEIEVKNENEAMKAAEIINKLKSKKLYAIMLDNMSPIKTKNSIKKINENYKNDNLLFEASGGINQGNIGEYSKTGVDVISLGFLTHSPKAFNMSLEVK